MRTCKPWPIHLGDAEAARSCARWRDRDRDRDVSASPIDHDWGRVRAARRTRSGSRVSLTRLRAAVWVGLRAVGVSARSTGHSRGPGLRSDRVRSPRLYVS